MQEELSKDASEYYTYENLIDFIVTNLPSSTK
jgi:hypothetical protein